MCLFFLHAGGHWNRDTYVVVLQFSFVLTYSLMAIVPQSSLLCIALLRRFKITISALSLVLYTKRKPSHVYWIKKGTKKEYCVKTAAKQMVNIEMRH